MDKPLVYTLKLSGEGLQMEREVSPEVAHSIVRLVFGSGVSAVGTMAPAPATLLPSTPSSQAAAPAAAVSLSVREFLETHNAKRIPEQIATIALYLKLHQNCPVFGRKDLIRSFEDAQEPVPKNLPRDINWTVKNGWIAPKTGAKKSYYLTGTGETAVSSKFPEEVRKKTKVTLRPRKKRKSQAAPKA